MNKLRLAAATSLTLAWMFSAPLTYAVGHPEQSTTDQVEKAQSDDQPLSTKNKGADTKAKSASKANNGTNKTTDKPAAETNKAAGHGPTSVMDRAAPDQKSPGAPKDSEAPAK